jgi:hypothetical protein
MGKPFKRLDPKTRSLLMASALVGEKSQTELASEYNVHPSLVSRLKTECYQVLLSHCSNHGPRDLMLAEKKIAQLECIIGQQTIAINELKKKITH